MGGGEPAPTRTATVLFSDIVGSTAVLTDHGKGAADELRHAHDRFVIAAAAANSGEVVKHLGDGMMTRFDSAQAGLAAARTVVRAAQRYSRTASVPLRLRLGVATGDVTVEDGDLFGRPVVEAARLCDTCSTDQVLISRVTAVMADGADFEIAEAGERELKGLGVVSVWELRWEAEHDEPPAGALPPSIARLPAVALAGREAEVEALHTAWGRSRSGRTVTIFGGEPGIGKTRLAEELARHVAASEGLVLLGRSTPGATVPFQMWVDPVERLLEQVPEATRDRLHERYGDALQPLLGKATDTWSVASGLAVDAQRHELLKAIVCCLIEVASEIETLLILDDLQWAGPASHEVLRHLIRSMGEEQLMVVCTYRSTDLSAGSPVSETLADCGRLDGVEVIDVEGLDERAVRRIASEVGPERGLDDLIDHVMTSTDGNALFVTEILRHAAASDGTAVPVSVRQAILNRVIGLGDDVAEVVKVSSVLGEEFDPFHVAAVIDRAEDQVLDALAAACAERIVEEIGTTRFRFAHGLIQEVIYDELGPARAGLLHRRVGMVLAGRPGAAAPTLADHRIRGMRPGDEAELVPLIEQAALELRSRLSPERAIDLLRTAVGFAVADDEGRLVRARLLRLLGQCQRDTGDAGFRETLLEAARLSDSIGDHHGLVEAVVMNNRGIASQTGAVDDERVAMLRRALEVVGPEPTAARSLVLSRLAVELTWCGELDERDALSAEAVEVARQSGDHTALLTAMVLRCDTVHVPQLLAERTSMSEAALSLVTDDTDPWLAAFAAESRLRTAAAVGDFDLVEAMIERELEIAERHALEPLTWWPTFHRAWLQTLRGDAARGEELVLEAFEIGTRSAQPEAFEILAAGLSNVHTYRGTLPDLIEIAAQAAETNPGIPGFRLMLANAYVDAGDGDQAARTMQPLIDSDFDLPLDIVWLSGLSLASYAVAHLRHREAARSLYDRIAPYAHHAVFPGTHVIEHASLPLARLAAVLGRDDVADRHFADALAAHRSWRSPFLIARTELEWAEALLHRDGERALEHARTAHAALERLGNRDHTARAAALLRDMGATP